MRGDEIDNNMKNVIMHNNTWEFETVGQIKNFKNRHNANETEWKTIMEINHLHMMRIFWEKRGSSPSDIEVYNANIEYNMPKIAKKMASIVKKMDMASDNKVDVLYIVIAPSLKT